MIPELNGPSVKLKAGKWSVWCRVISDAYEKYGELTKVTDSHAFVCEPNVITAVFYWNELCGFPVCAATVPWPPSPADWDALELSCLKFIEQMWDYLSNLKLSVGSISLPPKS